MLARIESAGIFGLTGFPVTVEADLSAGLPHYELVGLPDAAVKESRERVRSAIKNSGFDGVIYLEYEGMEDCEYGTRVSFDNMKRIYNEV